jgi:hypothetical protein
VTALLIALSRLVGAMWRQLKDEEFRALLVLVALLLCLGTLFYRSVEGWSALDAAFFSLITLTTVGYGDLVPTTGLSKVFTMVYLVIGISILVGFLNKVARGVVAQEHVLRARHKDKESDRK